MIIFSFNLHESSPLVSIITRYRQTKKGARSTSVASNFAVEKDHYSEHTKEEEEGDGGGGKDEVDKRDSKEGRANQNREVEKNSIRERSVNPPLYQHNYLQAFFLFVARVIMIIMSAHFVSALDPNCNK